MRNVCCWKTFKFAETDNSYIYLLNNMTVSSLISFLSKGIKYCQYVAQIKL